MASKKTLQSGFKNSDLSTHGEILKCDICEIKITYDSKSGATTLKRHLESDKHLSNKKLKSDKISHKFFKDTLLKPKNDYSALNAYSFIKANIPLQ